MRPKVIIVTGGIGSGKSVVCGQLAQKGIPVYDCDSRAKALYDVYPQLKAMIVADIFSHPAALKSLEDRLFPLLMDDFEAWEREQKTSFVAFESATVLQKDFFDNFGDYVVLVDAPDDIRLDRAVRRAMAKAGDCVGTDSMGIDQETLRADIRSRMALQTDDSSNPRVSFILENTGSMEYIGHQIDKFLKKINYYGN